jgi:hypothetical protein
MATSIIKRSSVVFAETTVNVSISPSEVKYYDTHKPNNNYAWRLYAVNTGTWALAANDWGGNGGGMRIKNNDANATTTRSVTLYWMGF